MDQITHAKPRIGFDSRPRGLTTTAGITMSIEELLRQMDEYHARRSNGVHDSRPEWLTEFVESAASVFEPLQGYGRVGFDAQGDERGWTVSLFLGTTEIIGGPKDGQIEHAGFMIDVMELQRLFETLNRFEWYSIANQPDDPFDGETRSVLMMSGEIKSGQNIKLELFHTPPRFAEAAFQKKTDPA